MNQCLPIITNHMLCTHVTYTTRKGWTYFVKQTCTSKIHKRVGSTAITQFSLSCFISSFLIYLIHNNIIYVYIYVSIYISLSLYIYIYIYIYTGVWLRAQLPPRPRGGSNNNILHTMYCIILYHCILLLL